MNNVCTTCSSEDFKASLNIKTVVDGVKVPFVICEDCTRSILSTLTDAKLSSDSKTFISEVGEILTDDRALREAFILKVNEKIEEQFPTKLKLDKLTPMQIAKLLGERVIGQQQAKEELAIVLHRKALREIDPSIDKLSILLGGPTATGKTELGRAAADLFDVPFVTVDINSISPASYKGANLTSILETLLIKAGNDQDKAERGIVLLDEFDKLIHKDNDSKLKDELLTFIEGGVFTIEKPHKPSVTFNTHNLTFIASGAFSGLLEKKTVSKKKVGMIQSVTVGETKTETFDLTAEKLVEWGCKEELAGRFTVISTLKKLTIDELYLVLTQKKNNAVEQYSKIFKAMGLDFRPSKAYLMSVCERANAQPTGVRTLKKILEADLRPYIMEAKSFISESDETTVLAMVA